MDIKNKIISLGFDGCGKLNNNIFRKMSWNDDELFDSFMEIYEEFIKDRIVSKTNALRVLFFGYDEKDIDVFYICDTAKESIKVNNLVGNRNATKESYWKNRNSTYIYEYILDCNRKNNEEYYNFSVSDTIRNIVGEEPKAPLKKRYLDVYDFLRDNKQGDELGTFFYNMYWGEITKIYPWVNSIQEARFCINNNITSIPKCKRCDNDTGYTIALGYKSFCSYRCQIENNNSIKESKYSNKPKVEIVTILNNINKDNLNRTNQKVADYFLNIEEYSNKHISKEFMDIMKKDSEMIYIYTNDLIQDDISCKCGNKKSFASYIQGYWGSCSNKKCIIEERDKNGVVRKTNNLQSKYPELNPEDIDKLMKISSYNTILKYGYNFCIECNHIHIKTSGTFCSINCINKNKNTNYKFSDPIGRYLSIDERIQFKEYCRIVAKYTYQHKKTIPKPLSNDNLDLDHKYSKFMGFKNNIPSYIIGDISNLEYLPDYVNRAKGIGCSITLEELYKEIFK